MSKQITEMGSIIENTAKNFGISEKKVEDMALYMLEYIRSTGSKYGKTSEGFYKWYTEDLGQQL